MGCRVTRILMSASQRRGIQGDAREGEVEMAG